jgi:hypothetical protein
MRKPEQVLIFGASPTAIGRLSSHKIQERWPALCMSPVRPLHNRDVVVNIQALGGYSWDPLAFVQMSNCIFCQCRKEEVGPSVSERTFSSSVNRERREDARARLTHPPRECDQGQR